MSNKLESVENMNDIGKISQQNNRNSQKSAHPNNAQKKSDSKLRFMRKNWLTFAVIAVLVVANGGAMFYYKFSDPGVKKDKYQAVFLADGQIYFGKLSGINHKYLKMTDVYYLQTNKQAATQESGEAQPQPELIKLGSEVHGPEDEMRIRADRVSYWENLKNDSKVTSAIRQFKKQQ